MFLTGIEGALHRARECVYWPVMNADLKEFFQNCELYNSYGQKQQKETMIAHEATDRPFEKIGVDLFELNGCNYLITVDYYSNFWEVDLLTSTSAVTVIRKLKEHFARYGIPSILISDNGPQFSSQEFKTFVSLWDVEHRTSSPGHQQANGKAEAAVKMAKRIIDRALKNNQDPCLAILEYRNIPSQDSLSPAQRMFGRMTHTMIPVHCELLKKRECLSEIEPEVKRLKKFVVL